MFSDDHRFRQEIQKVSFYFKGMPCTVVDTKRRHAPKIMFDYFFSWRKINFEKEPTSFILVKRKVFEFNINNDVSKLYKIRRRFLFDFFLGIFHIFSIMFELC